MKNCTWKINRTEQHGKEQDLQFGSCLTKLDTDISVLLNFSRTTNERQACHCWYVGIWHHLYYNDHKIKINIARFSKLFVIIVQCTNQVDCEVKDEGSVLQPDVPVPWLDQINAWTAEFAFWELSPCWPQ